MQTSTAQQRVVARYGYHDERGALLFEAVRFEPKSFAQRRPDGRGGWLWNLDGVRRVPYRLPQLLSTTGTVYVVEGEKDADRLADLGLAATCNPGGAGNWRPEFSPLFKGKHVIVCADSDGAGLVHAEDVARSLYPFARSVKILWLPGPEHSDVSDWLDTGWKLSNLLEVVQETPLWKPEPSQAPKIHSAQSGIDVRAESISPFLTGKQIAEITPAKVEHIVFPWQARGAITEYAGKIKLAGKTTLLTHGVRSALDGADFAGFPTRKTPVCYLTEQSRSTFRMAMERAGLLGREDFFVLFWNDVFSLEWPAIVDMAVQECQRRGAAWLVVDTIGQFTGIEGDGENSSGEALTAMKPLQLAAANHGLSISVGRHERKSGGDVGESARGSTAFGGAADTIVSVRRPEGNHRDTIRELRAISRFADVPYSLLVELKDGAYVSLGESHAVELAEARGMILGSAPKGEAEALPLGALISGLKISRATAQRAMEELRGVGSLQVIGAGKKGDPFRYFLPEKFILPKQQTLNGQKERQIPSLSLKGQARGGERGPFQEGEDMEFEL